MCTVPVVEGRLNRKRVRVLQDTGCSSAAVREALVEEHQMTGLEVMCVLDGTERRVPDFQWHTYM